MPNGAIIYQASCSQRFLKMLIVLIGIQRGKYKFSIHVWLVLLLNSFSIFITVFIQVAVFGVVMWCNDLEIG
jgi:hypothetical protein